VYQVTRHPTTRKRKLFLSLLQIADRLEEGERKVQLSLSLPVVCRDSERKGKREERPDKEKKKN